MNETVVKRCLQGVLGRKAKRHSEDIQGGRHQNSFPCRNQGVLHNFLQAQIRLRPLSLQSTYHCMISHCFQGTVQNLSMQGLACSSLCPPVQVATLLVFRFLEDATLGPGSHGSRRCSFYLAHSLPRDHSELTSTQLFSPVVKHHFL